MREWRVRGRMAMFGVIVLGSCGGEPDCADVAPDVCANTVGCVPIRGRAVEEGDDGPCVDFFAQGEALGCLAAGAGCAGVEVTASAPDDPDRLALFPSSCLPEGWQEVETEVAECVR